MMRMRSARPTAPFAAARRRPQLSLVLHPVRREAGFSLAELLASLALLALLAGVGLYVINTSSWRDAAAARDFTSRLEYARQQAILDQNNYVVTFDLTNNQYTILDDDNNNGVANPEIGERVTTHLLGASGSGVVFGYPVGARGPDNALISAAVTFAGAPPRVTFTPLGTAADGWVYLTTRDDLLRNAPTNMRAISISAATARIRQWRYKAEAAAPGPWKLER